MFCTLWLSFGVYSIGEHQSKTSRTAIGSYTRQSKGLSSLIGWLSAGGGLYASLDVVVVSGGEITLSVVVRFGILRVVPPMKMLKS